MKNNQASPGDEAEDVTAELDAARREHHGNGERQRPRGATISRPGWKFWRLDSRSQALSWPVVVLELVDLLQSPGLDCPASSCRRFARALVTA
jgi:hypothetical protein